LSRILFAWELGANLGHVAQLAPIAARLEEEGHDLLFAVKDMTAAHQVLRGKRTRIVQAPIARRTAKYNEPSISYAEMLGRVGYATPESISALLRGWLDLFKLFDPQTVVADHAPTALLAGRIAGLPRVDIATGFTRPPQMDPIPSIQPWRKIPQERLAHAEALVLQRINAALRAHRAAPLDRFADLFKVEASFLATFEELDHYEGRTGEQYHGALIPEDMGVERDWPAGDRPHVVAYLRPSESLEPTLDAIVATGSAALCHIPGAELDLVERYRKRGIDISREPLKLKAALKGAHASVSYAGHGFVSASLLAGVPSLMLPINGEQAITARRVVGMKAGLAISPTRDVSTLTGKLKVVLEGRHHGERAKSFSVRYSNTRQSRISSRIANEIPKIEYVRPSNVRQDTCAATQDSCA
jgi:UDP:flavonoid glycosyltransferase YjiC (YdhE family)